uniref:Uncharacterized protein n=1 Tax=Anguilla anguilla TaxID=7936 RepID=A0A0E9RGE5_ANGAN
MDTTLEQLALVNGILKPTISNKIEVLKEKFKEMKASAIVANEKSELAAAVNGGVREENPANGVEVAGEDALNEGLEDQVSEASAENEEKAKAECYKRK